MVADHATLIVREGAGRRAECPCGYRSLTWCIPNRPGATLSMAAASAAQHRYEAGATSTVDNTERFPVVDVDEVNYCGHPGYCTCLDPRWADHVEHEHERELTTGTDARAAHRQMHGERDWAHDHEGATI